MTKKLQPKLRFRGFTDAWEQRKLGSLGTSYSGLSGKDKTDFGHGSGSYITYLNVFQNPIADIDDTDRIEIDPKQNTVHYGDAFFTVSSETPEEVGMSSVWLGNQPNVYLNSFCFGYRQNGTFDTKYLAYMLRSRSIRKRMKILAQGISRFNISQRRVMDIEVSFPSMDEQRKIGVLCGKLDQLIAAEKRKLSLLEKKKEAYSRIVFADSRNHKQNGEKRKIVRLGDVATRITRRNFGQSNLPLTISARDGLIDQREYFNKQVASKNLNDYTLLRQGEFAYNKSASSDSPWGTIKRLDKYDQGCVSTLYICFSIHDIDSQFLTALFDSSQWHSEIQAVATEGARNHGLLNVSASDFFNMRMRIPVLLSEQEHIGKFFATFKELTQRVSRKIELLELRKKALLQHMFI